VLGGLNRSKRRERREVFRLRYFVTFCGLSSSFHGWTRICVHGSRGLHFSLRGAAGYWCESPELDWRFLTDGPWIAEQDAGANRAEFSGRPCSQGFSTSVFRSLSFAFGEIAHACLVAHTSASPAGLRAERRRPMVWSAVCVARIAEVLCGSLSGDGVFQKRTTIRVGVSWRPRSRTMPEIGFRGGRSLHKDGSRRLIAKLLVWRDRRSRTVVIVACDSSSTGGGRLYKTSPNQTVQRTGASRFAQRQIERHRRLAPVADLCVRRRATPSGLNRRQRSKPSRTRSSVFSVASC